MRQVSKKRDLLDANYNPVAEQIKRYKRSLAPGREPDDNGEQAPSSPPTTELPKLQTKSTPAVRDDSGLRGFAPQAEVRLEPVSSVQISGAIGSERGAEQEARVLESRAVEQRTDDPVSALSTSLRTRVTRAEHQYWVDTCLRITGKQNQFSAIVRALLILLENSQEHLDKHQDDLHRLRVPQRNDRLANTIYEYRLAEVLYDAISSAGRPKPPGVMRVKR